MNKKLLILFTFIVCNTFAEVTIQEKLIWIEIAKKTFLQKSEEERVQAFQAFALKCFVLQRENDELKQKMEELKTQKNVVSH